MTSPGVAIDISSSNVVFLMAQTCLITDKTDPSSVRITHLVCHPEYSMSHPSLP